MSTEIEQILDHAEAECKSRGSRLTAKRKRVLSSLLQSQKAVSAYELIDQCKAQFGESMPAMSMYRILDFLQAEHLVHRLKSANKYIACTHITCDHDHGVPQFLICGTCEQVKEIRMASGSINSLRKNVEAAGFHMQSQQLEIDCLCQSCKDGQLSA